MQSGQPFALQACANVLWALGVLQAANNPTAMRIVHFMSRQGGGPLLNTHYHQLFQVRMLPGAPLRSPAPQPHLVAHQHRHSPSHLLAGLLCHAPRCMPRQQSCAISAALHLF